jgi:hypothetical protein
VQLQHKSDNLGSISVERDSPVTVSEGQQAVDNTINQGSDSVIKVCKDAGEGMKKKISKYPPNGVSATGNVARNWCEQHPDYKKGIRVDLENLAGTNFTS